MNFLTESVLVFCFAITGCVPVILSTQQNQFQQRPRIVFGSNFPVDFDRPAYNEPPERINDSKKIRRSAKIKSRATTEPPADTYLLRSLNAAIYKITNKFKVPKQLMPSKKITIPLKIASKVAKTAVKHPSFFSGFIGFLIKTSIKILPVVKKVVPVAVYNKMVPRYVRDMVTVYEKTQSVKNSIQKIANKLPKIPVIRSGKVSETNVGT